MSRRIDSFPTDKINGFNVRIGSPLPFGATRTYEDGVNFSIYSSHATSCTLVLFHSGEETPFAELVFPKHFQIGDVYAMIVYGLNIEDVEYGYRFDGPSIPQEGHCFSPEKILLDPYARMVTGRDKWAYPPVDWEKEFPYRGKILVDDFDWEDDFPPGIPMEDLVIYELHVRGFTRHNSSRVKYPGTYAGLIEKIPYLKHLGINAVELMPIHEFDEWDNVNSNPSTGKRLKNFWGYNTLAFFAPKAGYSNAGEINLQADELKNMVKQFHKNGIEVFLDVVFNHTPEGNEQGPYISFRGIDNKTYYILSVHGKYCNFSGCGNTLNCNHPQLRGMIIDCLRYWVTDYHVDGFRFDLAAILGRGQDGQLMTNPPVLESLAFDPILGKCKLIAEAWDASGLNMVGRFPSWQRWAEWNGHFRDVARRFLRGDINTSLEMGCRLQGSPDLFHGSGRGPRASINFISCHDGFTMYDLFSYNQKHNQENGEENRDGNNNSYTWNCGTEGEPADSSVMAMRILQMKNAAAVLLLSQGVPMFCAGDEMARTQCGNNNAYCQDNAISWLDWTRLKKFSEVFDFFRKLIVFRKKHSLLRHRAYFSGFSNGMDSFPDISWHGLQAWNSSSGVEGETLAYMLDGKYTDNGDNADNTLFIIMNMHSQPLSFEIPHLPGQQKWHVAINTAMPPPDDIYLPGDEIPLERASDFLVGARSVVVLLAK